MTDKLKGVHPDLQKVVLHALAHGSAKWQVTEGLRTLERQQELFAAGKSKTMKSRHLLGCAVDVVALTGGAANWSIDAYMAVAADFAMASEALNIPIRWGACWQLLRTDMNYGKEIDKYAAAARAEGRRPLIDAVHFELPVSVAYP